MSLDNRLMFKMSLTGSTKLIDLKQRSQDVARLQTYVQNVLDWINGVNPSKTEKPKCH